MKLISVWGSPNSGKTTLSIEIAKVLSSRINKNCLIIFTDDLTSPLNYLFPSLSEQGDSLGRIITSAGFYQDELIKGMVYHPDYKHLCFLGFRKNETRYNYSEISEMQVLDLFVSLSQLVDYVIVDCTSDFTNNPISQHALREGSCIQVGGGDLKSISYFNDTHYLSQAYPGMRERNTIVANNPNDFDIWKSVAEQYGQTQYYFPFVMDLQDHYLEEKSLSLLKPNKHNRDFLREMEQLVRNIIDGDIDTTVKPLKEKKKAKPKKSFFRKKQNKKEETHGDDGSIK